MGIKLPSSQGYFLSQSKYVADIIEQARLTVMQLHEMPLKLNGHYSSNRHVPFSNPTSHLHLDGIHV